MKKTGYLLTAYLIHKYPVDGSRKLKLDISESMNYPFLYMQLDSRKHAIACELSGIGLSDLLEGDSRKMVADELRYMSLAIRDIDKGIDEGRLKCSTTYLT